jgi:two-component system CheB/CheR fusion protein
VGPERPEAAVPATLAAFPVVGIGASAGGLAAFEAFLGGVQAEPAPGMAFVLVQHLAPDHKSLLVELVKRFTWMPVCEVEDGMRLAPDCVYVIPPGRDLGLRSGRLRLLEPTTPRGHHLPIDFFFRSLAQEQGERAIGIVLAGTGSDGTLGLQAIKDEGGLVLAQTPGSTEYDGMPRSAIATGLVDYELRPEEMAAQLRNCAAQVRIPASGAASAPDGPAEVSLREIFTLLLARTGHDFAQYKLNTIQRRVERRMGVHHLASVADYARYLGQAPQELDALFRDLLIGVTRFFRDPEAFQALQELAIPRLFAGKAEGALVRVWVPGCATGEEAYSLAILLQEHMETLGAHYLLQVFATDLDLQAIQRGRAGLYPASVAADVSPERLARWFTREPDRGGFRIHKAIRDLLIFSDQDLIRDPPFSRLDMVSCRNLLIYLGGDLQKQLIPLFNYALNPGGILFLGSSETVGASLDLFAPLDRRWKIYQQQPVSRGGFGGSLGGPARERLRPELAAAIHGAVTRATPVLREGLQLSGAPGSGMGQLSLRPLPGGAEGVFQVVFEAQPAEPGAGPEAPADGVDARVAALQRALRVKEEALQGTLQEMAASNEELKSINEEMQSGNEELQSTNEEMETSREELQSVNEELATVNAELQQRLDELTRTNNDMSNLLAGTGVATVFLDEELCIRRFTPAATQVINLIPGDVGRPLSHIASNLVQYDRLVEDAREVLASLVPRETEVQVRGGAWYLLRILPYRTQDNVVQGAVILFVDITEQRRLQAALQDAEALGRLAVVVRDASDAITVRDFTGRILAWNPGAERIYGWTEAEALTLNARDLVPEELRDQALDMARQLSQGRVLEPRRTRRLGRDGQSFAVWLTITALIGPTGNIYALATTERRIDARLDDPSGGTGGMG